MKTLKDLEYYMNLAYLIVIREFIDEGDTIFEAKIEELPGLKIYSSSLDEALCELNEAKEAWLETSLELNRPIREPKDSLIEYSGLTTIRMSRSLRKKLAELAEEENISLNAVIAQLLERIMSGVA
ncbi:MAG: toxin-antitoxin system HicB family antitoxin [Eubacteriales bacterium]|nr:toxin-antitoxin system HicB family antitoxin [Eubacteriales bacterium]